MNLAITQFLAAAAASGPKLEDISKSYQDSLGGDLDTDKFLYILLGVISLIVLLAVLAQQRKRFTRKKSTNRPGKLLREIIRAAPLKKRELKQLKILADNADTEEPVQNPLALMLCPSVIARTIQKKRLKVDRKALIGVARKAGLQVAKR
jgi:hypothetical protein